MREVVDLGQVVGNVEILPDIPIPPPDPPKPKKIQQPKLIEVPEDEIIEELPDIAIDPDEIEIDDSWIVEPMSEPVDEPDTFFIVEEMPEPVGGYSSFYEFISRNIKYPPQARRLGIEGKVFLQFVVDENGEITGSAVVKGIGAGCDEEALRVLKKAPRWYPGRQRGVATRVRMTIPITFRLN